MPRMGRAKEQERRAWEGTPALEPFLVPLDSVEPFPGNPRRGDVAVVRDSLRRFGQQRPVLLNPDGSRIVAGHHVVLAGRDLGWTHVAAIRGEFGSEEEARAYLIADNGTHDRGDYDLRELHSALALLSAGAGLEGTGYEDADLDYLARQVADLDRTSAPPSEFPPLNPDELPVQYRCPSCQYEWSGNPRPGGGPAGE